MSKLSKPRNPVATSPLLRKGGVHRKNATARRADARRELRRTLAELAQIGHNQHDGPQAGR